MKAKLRLNAKIIGELTPEQRTELIAMYEQMRERMMKKRGPKAQKNQGT